jgi:hypothetical protein
VNSRGAYTDETQASTRYGAQSTSLRVKRRLVNGHRSNTIRSPMKSLGRESKLTGRGIDDDE